MASSYATWTTGWCAMSSSGTCGPRGWRQLARNPGPPVRVVAEIDRPASPLEHHRTGDEVLRRSARKGFGARRPLGNRHVARLLDEARELFVGDGALVDPEPADRHGVHRTFFGIVGRGAHLEGAAGDPRHVGGDATSAGRLALIGTGVNGSRVSIDREHRVTSFTGRLTRGGACPAACAWMHRVPSVEQDAGRALARSGTARSPG